MVGRIITLRPTVIGPTTAITIRTVIGPTILTIRPGLAAIAGLRGLATG